MEIHRTSRFNFMYCSLKKDDAYYQACFNLSGSLTGAFRLEVIMHNKYCTRSYIEHNLRQVFKYDQAAVTQKREV